ncbi:uncharacterized protein LOC110869497 [Helianthus annuus]|uniref:uncharacterized protein LOC110869497 n=1 Tax=Helianthus annuus TaxID=4232 RepID=UPI000B9098B2|nr:uncharacterized protein LOC110869497 [Helianthus annuus]
MRQGDPISPFLFVVAMEALSCIIDKVVEVGVLPGIKLPNDGPTLSHLFFADDALIVGEWGENNAMNVVRILRCFHACSGLRINLSKSNLYGIGANSAEVEDLANVVGCKKDTLPFKYLGLKVGANMNRINNWKPVYDIFESRLALWKSAFLSMVGRITLIRSVLQSLPSYYFSLYRAPVKVIKDLKGKIKKVLWGGSNEVKKLTGSLGMLWLRLKKAVVWGLVIFITLTLLFFANGDEDTNVRRITFGLRWLILSMLVGRAGRFFRIKSPSVWVWHNIVAVFNKPVQGGSKLRNLFRGSVGRGDSLLFWLDPWLTDSPLKDIYLNLFSLEVVKSCLVRDRLAGNWLWRHDPSLEDEMMELSALTDAVDSVSLSDGNDRWIWKGDSSTCFSVGSLKRVLEGAPVNDSGFFA